MSPATASRSETATRKPQAQATAAIASTAVEVWALESTPSAAERPTTGAQSSCQRTRTRAGASKAMKPQIIAAVASPAACSLSSSRSEISASPTGIATQKPRRIAGSGAPRSRQAAGTRAATLAPVRCPSPPSPASQFRVGSAGIRAISANCPPLRASTSRHRVSGSAANSSAWRGRSTIQASCSSSPSS